MSPIPPQASPESASFHPLILLHCPKSTCHAAITGPVRPQLFGPGLATFGIPKSSGDAITVDCSPPLSGPC